MKYFKYVLICLLMFLFTPTVSYSTKPLGLSPAANSPHPHTPLGLTVKPAPSTVKTAGIYWLPDYLQDNLGTSASASEDNGGTDFHGKCETYGLHSPQAVNSAVYQCDSYNVKPTPDLTCYKNCRCQDKYKFTSANCTGSSIPAGASCDNKYEQCVCKSEFTYDTSNCKGQFQPSGQTCGGKYNACTGLPCSAGGFTDSPQTERKCSITSFGGRNCYNCYQPECSEGGYLATAPENKKCASVSYYGRTCQSKCYQPECAEGGFQHTVPSNQKCTPTTFFGRTCQSKCYQPECAEGGYLATIPVNQKCNSTIYYGRTCQTNCTALTCTDGGYLSTCDSTNFICTVKTYAGKTCYTQGRAKTCEEKGSQTCNGTCIASSQCCSDSQCSGGKKCNLATHACYSPDPCASVTDLACAKGCRVYDDKCGNCTKCYKYGPGDIFYSDNTVSSSLIAGKTPIGIVWGVNSDNFAYIIALNEKDCPKNYDDAQNYCKTYSTPGRGAGSWTPPHYYDSKIRTSLLYNESTFNLVNTALSKINGATRLAKANEANYWTDELEARQVISYKRGIMVPMPRDNRIYYDLEDDGIFEGICQIHARCIFEHTFSD